MRAALLVVGLVFILIQGVVAFNVSQITTDPSNVVTPGTPMNVTGTIHFESSSAKTTTGPPGLLISTDLEKALWGYAIVLDGREGPQSQIAGKTLTVNGWLLSNPGTAEESVRFSLSGVAPSVARTKNVTLAKIQETDGQGNAVPGTSYEYHAVVVGFDPPPRPLLSDLSEFRSHIDEKAALGIDTTAAEAKYSEADALFKTANNRPSSQFQLARADLDAAQKIIDEGEAALDKAWAEKEVADAQELLNQTDAIISWLRSNSSIADDTRLPVVITKREVALSYFVTARNEITQGNYDRARDKAQDAYRKANESYNEGLSIQQNPPQTIVDPPPVSARRNGRLITAGIVAIVIIIAGILWWRKRKRWSLE